MKVLLVSLEAQTGPSNGLRLPLRQLLDRLHCSHDVHVIAYRMPDQPTVEDPTVTTIVRSEPSGAGRLVEAATALATRHPTSTRRLADGLRTAVLRELQHDPPDVVHVVGGSLAGLADVIGDRPSVLTAMDAASLNVRSRADVATGARRALLLDEARRTVRFQGRHFPHFDQVVMVSQEDADIVTRLAPGVRTTVIPNGVEVPQDEGVRERIDGGGPTVLFHGALSYAPNVLAVRHLVEEVWPLVRRERPDARLVLVGRSPAPEVRSLALDQGVHLVGEVADVWPWLRAADVYACPITSGTGIKNKLLEALGARLPCVVSTLATQGMDVVHGDHVLVADGSEPTATAIVSLLDDHSQRVRLGAAAAAYVAAAHSWDAFAEAYSQLYATVSHQGGGSR